MLALDKIFDDLVVVECLRVAEQVQGSGAPVQAINPQMLCQPILEVIFFLKGATERVWQELASSQETQNWM